MTIYQCNDSYLGVGFFIEYNYGGLASSAGCWDEKMKPDKLEWPKQRQLQETPQVKWWGKTREVILLTWLNMTTAMSLSFLPMAWIKGSEFLNEDEPTEHVLSADPDL